MHASFPVPDTVSRSQPGPRGALPLGQVGREPRLPQAAAGEVPHRLIFEHGRAVPTPHRAAGT